MTTGKDILELEDRIEEIRDGIHKQFPDIEWPEPVMEPAFYGRLKKKPIPERFAMVDANSGHVFDVVSGQYNLRTHEEVVFDVLSSLPVEFGEPEIDIRLYQNAARVRLDVTFPGIPEHVGEIKKGDMVEPRISAYSSLDRSTHHGIITGAKQLVCSNGLVAYREIENKRRHILGASVTPEELTGEIVTFLEDFSKTTDLWRNWANQQLTFEEISGVMESLPFSEPEVEKIMELPLMNNDNKFLKQLEKPTLWDVNSAATQFAKHEVRGDQRSMDLEQQISAVLYNL